MIQAQQVGAIPVSGLQSPTIGLQAGVLPATTTATQWTDLMNTMMPMLMFMMMMMMMMKPLSKMSESV